MYLAPWPEIIGTLWISGKLAWYPLMPWQPMHIATLLSMVALVAVACCAWAAGTTPARASSIEQSSAFFMGEGGDVQTQPRIIGATYTGPSPCHRPLS